MTGKRFRFEIKTQGNKAYTQWYDEDKEINSAETLCDLLNELYEENDVLKEELKTKIVVNKQYEELQKFKEENELLKQLCELLKEKIEFYEDQIINPECPICHTILRKISIDWKKDRYYRKCSKCGYEREESLI